MRTEKRILLVEDEIHIARAIATILKKSLTGYEVDVAKDGMNALERIASQDYVMIISDWNMPKKDGAELLGDLRADERTSDLPFVMLTAKGDKDSVSAAYAAGANDYVIKPFKTPEFVAKIKAQLDATTAPCPVEDSLNGSPTEAVIAAFRKGQVQLPVLPCMVSKVNELFASKGASAQALARVVELDAVISGKLINIANSPLLRGRSDCATVERAITRMGVEQARNYIVVLANESLFVSQNRHLDTVLEDLWRHSLATAYCADYLGKALGMAPGESLFLLGLLHDIGKLVLVGHVNELSKTRSDLDRQAIAEIMEQLHSEFGVALLEGWGYPEWFQGVVRYHHAPFNAPEVTPGLLVVYLANLMVRKIGFGKEEEEIENVADSQAAIELKVNGEMIARVLEQTRQAMVAVRQLC